MTVLEFHILGPLEVLRDGVPLELAGHRQKALLVLLLLEPGRLVSSDRVVEALWGENSPPTAGASLRNVVAQLRKLLGPGTLETREGGYVLRVDAGSIDLFRFDRAVREARAAPAAVRASLFREALDVWRGPPLPEFADEAFFTGEIRRVEELRLSAHEDAVDAELEAGLAAELVPELQALAAEHPHRERLRGQLMLALYRSGRQAEALAVYQDARRVLAEDLGLDPSPALRQLHGAILRQEAGIAAPANRGGAAAGGAGHLNAVAEAILAGRVVPVIACSAEIAATLAERFDYPLGGAVETPRVSQYAATLRGYGPLYDELRSLALAAGEPTSVHRFFASLPPLLRERGVPQQLLVTADYDGALERAFQEAGEAVDVVSYLAFGRDRGRFCHLAPDGLVQVIANPSDYAAELPLEHRPVILRVRGRAESDSFVVTEDDHIEYLGRSDLASAVPIALAAPLRRSHFLFLGYTMSDWCLRLVLGRIWSEPPAYRSWAVGPGIGPTEPELWRRLDVEYFDTDPGPYVEALRVAIAERRGVRT